MSFPNVAHPGEQTSELPTLYGKAPAASSPDEALKRFANIEGLLAVLPVGIVLATEDGLISSVNPAAERMFGYRQEELLRNPLQTLFIEDVAVVASPELAAPLSLRGVRKDRSTFPLHAQIQPLRLVEGSFLVVNLLDLTQHKAVEGALLESEHRFRQLAETLPQLVWTCTPDGICDYLSPQWVEYTGLPESEQLSLGWIEQVHSSDRTALFTAWSEAVRLGTYFRFDYRLRRHDGNYRWFDTRAIPLRNVNDEIVKWFGSSTDIHEAVETRAALANERQALTNLITLAPAVFFSYAFRHDGSAYFPYASPGIFDLYGIQPELLKEDARHFLPLLNPSDRASFHASMDHSIRTMSQWNAEYRIFHPTKGERWVQGSATPATGENGALVWHGFLTDITERKALDAGQQFLLELGAALQTADSPQAILRAATHHVSVHFNLRRCGLSAIDIGANRATVLFVHAREGDLIPPAGTTFPLTNWGSQERIDSLASGKTVAVADASADPITAPFYARAFHPQGIEAFIDVPLRRNGQCVAVLSLFDSVRRSWTQHQIDLARVAAERIWPAYESARSLAAEREMHGTLAASEERLRLAMQSAALGIWERNLVTDEIQWDTRFAEIFGFSGPFTADDVFQCFHPEDRERIIDLSRAYRDPAGNGQFAAEYRIHRFKDGALRYIYARAQSFFVGEGPTRRAVRAIGTVQDVTALEQKERALRLANKELEEFAYAASHDLKGPLRVIDNASRWLEEDLAPRLDSQTLDHMNLLRGRVQRMEKLLDDLLDYARIGRSDKEREPELVPGDVLVADVLALVPMGRFTVAIGAGFSSISIPRMPLQQILLNLIGNAIKHHHKTEGRIEVTVEDAGPHYVFAVKDDGPGIPARFHEKIFGMFQTLRPRDQVEGSGMGLALVRKHIDVSGGVLRLESGEGAGSTFSFTWPKTPTQQTLNQPVQVK